MNMRAIYTRGSLMREFKASYVDLISRIYISNGDRKFQS